MTDTHTHAHSHSHSHTQPPPRRRRLQQGFSGSPFPAASRAAGLETGTNHGRLGKIRVLAMTRECKTKGIRCLGKITQPVSELACLSFRDWNWLLLRTREPARSQGVMANAAADCDKRQQELRCITILQQSNSIPQVKQHSPSKTPRQLIKSMLKASSLGAKQGQATLHGPEGRETCWPLSGLFLQASSATHRRLYRAHLGKFRSMPPSAKPALLVDALVNALMFRNSGTEMITIKLN